MDTRPTHQDPAREPGHRASVIRHAGRPVEVVGLPDLTANQVASWQALHDEFGTGVQQSPAYAQAVSGAGGQVLVASSRDRIAAFTHDGTVCTALGGDLPLLGVDVGTADLLSVVTAVRRTTGLPVYLPLVDHGYADVAGHGEFATWNRPSNSVIDWSDEGQDLQARVRARGTSQSDRKRRLVERDGLVLDAGRSGDEAAREVLEVDDRSWKAERGQSMRRRGNQSDLYGRLVRSATLTVTFLRDGPRPVAFRLDGRVKDRVTCLKWSYDEAYRRYSPGLYLLTEGLRRQWAGQGVRLIDLFGSPDSLKDLLYTHRLPRIDVWCGDPARGHELAQDRLALDDRVARVRDDGKGLRYAFE